MISNQALATLFLITLNIQRAASASIGTKNSIPSSKSTLRVKKCWRAVKPKKLISVLKDMTNNMDPVEVQVRSTEVMSASQELAVPHVNNQFKTLIEQGEYEKIFEIGEDMSDEEFLKQLCQVIETLEQYNEIVDHLKRRKMVASFYIHGSIEVVKEAIVKSKVYVNKDYAKKGNLEAALFLALEKDHHYRIMELLDVRKGITAEMDKQRWPTSFGSFMLHFLGNLAPWKDGIAFRRFLDLGGEELGNRYREILDTLCRWLVHHLSVRLHRPKAERLLVDLIGQSTLLTPAIFAREFLNHGFDEGRSNFIKYGWREIVQEGLTTGHYDGGGKLWRVIQEEQPGQFPEEFPDTEEALAAALKHFPTKQQKEGEWYKECSKIFFNKLDSESIFHIFPDVLWPIIFGYAVSLTFTWNLTTSTE